MTQDEASTRPEAATAPDPRDAEAGVLAFLAQTELSSFERFSTDARFAESLEDTVGLGRLAWNGYGLFDSLAERIRELDREPLELMAPVHTAFQDFSRHTQPGDWYESLMKSLVVDGIFRDVNREMIAVLEGRSLEVATVVIDNTVAGDYLSSRLGEAVGDDEQLAARLALWGRRLVAESIHRGKTALLRSSAVHGARAAAGLLNADRSAATSDSAAASAAAAEPEDPAQASEAAVARIMSRVTEAHSRRMAALGLVA